MNSNSFNITISTFYFNSRVATHLQSPNQIREWANYQIGLFRNSIGFSNLLFGGIIFFNNSIF